jgi:formate dehydrogenase alpha subunit
VAGLAATFGSGAMTNSIADIGESDCILLTGTNTTENHPVIATIVKRAVSQRGASLIVVDPRGIDLARHATVWLRQKPGTDSAWINGMIQVILSEGLADEKFVADRTENFDALKETVKKYTPPYVESITGIPADELIKAARIYAGAKAASILYAMGITQHTKGTDNVKSIANLAMLTGNIGRPGTGVNPLRGQNNVQGACDMGALPNVFSGYQAVNADESAEKFEKAWGTTLPRKPGLALTEMMEAAVKGSLKALYVMGENPMISDPDLNHLEPGLKKLDLLVVQDLFLHETGELAHVVLPSAAWGEKEGTYTNTERRVQRIRKAVDAPGKALTDWEIITGLAGKMGAGWSYTGPQEIMNEINAVTPSYGGITYDRIEHRGLQWPCPTLEHSGTAILHKDAFTRGRGLFSAIEYTPAAEVPDKEYPYILTTGRILYQYHTATMSRRSSGLVSRTPDAFVEINPEDAKKFNLNQGDRLTISSRRGTIQAHADISEKCGQGVVFIPFHYSEAAVNRLTNAKFDPIAKIPEYKVCAVKIEKG